MGQICSALLFLIMFTNAQILSAVINKWSQPFVKTMLSGKFNSIGFLHNLEAKIKATGWVGPNYQLMQDLSPLIDSITGSVVTPMLTRYLSQIDDATIPQMAHSIVDDAIKKGSLTLFDGKIVFETEDLEELKKLLEYNLPLKEEEIYNVRTE